MKYFFTVLLLFFVTVIPAQTSQEAKNIVTLCKIWGFLKYHHPEVAKGNLDWDQEFMKRVKDVSEMKSRGELSKYYLTWIESLGEVKKCKKCKNKFDPKETKNLNIGFIDDTLFFTSELSEKLKYIRQNRNQEGNYYVQPYYQTGNLNFDSENPYPDAVAPSLSMRLLALSRFWNIYNYFFPYMYLNDYEWNQVLTDMVPVFYSADNEKKYLFAVMELTGKVNDSHAGIKFQEQRKAFGGYRVPFLYSIINDKAVVTVIVNDSLAAAHDIKIGDAITHANGQSIKQWLDENAMYFAYSNKPVLYRKAANVLLNGFSDSLQITLERNGELHSKTITRIPPHEFKYPEVLLDTFRILENNIGYVNMGFLVKDDVSKMMKKLWNTDGIIFDVRNYPQGTMYDIMEYLSIEQQKFVTFTYPDVHHPGIFAWRTNPLKCGKKNKDFYHGRVVVLMNEETQSHAEFTIMSFQTAPNITCIGSQTSGADGNSSAIVFPGGYKSMITGLGVYYPDGKETQRIGIVPDIEVKPTIKGICEGRDEVLEKAIEVIKNKD